MASFSDMLEQIAFRSGLTVGQIAWRLGLSARKYRELEAGENTPSFETYDQICKLFGWPQTFTSGRARG